MQTSTTGIQLIKDFEKLSLKPYLCSAGVPTIGWGNTFYPNGKKVTMKDPAITEQRAEEIFKWVLSLFENDVNSLVKVPLKQHQFDALVSFAYNVGSDIDADDIPEGLGDSKLLRMINTDPNKPGIETEFLKWCNAGGKKMKGLLRRRMIEATLYKSGVLNLKLVV
jgi:lysozyme